MSYAVGYCMPDDGKPNIQIATSPNLHRYMDNKFTLDVCDVFDSFVPEVIVFLDSFGVGMSQDGDRNWVVEIEGRPQALHLYNLTNCWCGYVRGVRIVVRRDAMCVAISIQEMKIGGRTATKYFS